MFPDMLASTTQRVAGDFLFIQRLAFGITHDSVSASDNISNLHNWIPELQSAFVRPAPRPVDGAGAPDVLTVNRTSDLAELPLRCTFPTTRLYVNLTAAEPGLVKTGRFVGIHKRSRVCLRHNGTQRCSCRNRDRYPPAETTLDDREETSAHQLRNHSRSRPAAHGTDLTMALGSTKGGVAGASQHDPSAAFV
jgi:hypothetical protein